MATKFELSGEELKVRFAQLARAELPFNPLDAMEITGANVARLQRSMKSFGWRDPRFITKAQAAANGWTFKPKSESVEIQIRNEENGVFDTVPLVNAENVRGMPSLAAMLELTDAAFLKMRGTGPTAPSPAPDEELSIGPARAVDRDIEPEALNSGHMDKPVQLQPGFKILVAHGVAPYLKDAKNKASYFVSLDDGQGDIETIWGVDLDRSLSEAGVQIGDAIALAKNGHKTVDVEERQPDGSVIQKPAERVNWVTSLQSKPLNPALNVSAQGHNSAASGNAESAALEGVKQPPEMLFAAMAPYWQDGLHNFEGVALAKEINEAIRVQNLAGDKQSIERLLAVYPKARRLGIGVVPENQYLNDPHLKANLSEPRSLLDGALVRDKEGAYRPKAGGLAVLQDLGVSVTLKSKSAEAYRGAMELAVTKGWTAIELKGKPAMLADAWLEAKLMGLDVVNYSPTEKDKTKYAERVAEESRRKGTVQSGVTEQAPEIVEVRPFIDASGHETTATVTYTVSYQGGKDLQFDNPKEAAKAFAALPAAGVPVVVRSVTRADGVVRDDVVAGIGRGQDKGAVARSVEPLLDQEFDAAMAEAIEEEKIFLSLQPTRAIATTGTHIGPITAIEAGRFAQKTGRDPDKVVWHDLAGLKGKTPKVGESVEIGYSQGIATVKTKELQRDGEDKSRGMER